MTQTLAQRPRPASVLKPPFGPPARLPPDQARVLAYWRGLLRGSAEVPFWDDARLSDLPDLAPRLVLIDVQAPERFRFAEVGEAVGRDLEGRFLDDTPLGRPLEFLRAQASATVEAARPTYFAGDPAYSRLLLPMWGDGRISMLLGSVEFA